MLGSTVMDMDDGMLNLPENEKAGMECLEARSLREEYQLPAPRGSVTFAVSHPPNASPELRGEVDWNEKGIGERYHWLESSPNGLVKLRDVPSLDIGKFDHVVAEPRDARE
jgi:hypothetical protein